ncbi:hypothetical protein GCM10018793_22730 [Streptomyces sulfonofaciens]|uniref:Endonuclease/exonuclease/phosphatase domain-containing protein n=1 Tax=Streptomyces sulfonofaciens TaxID=68272 RepID=A0A919G2C7_9ACTN|nr:endonuclease/exonuclease/phosphatase family protein [Streptomyces sulfonofaciens]GHH76611.1 hypothetical protein GCM10018793_22730 [Streptomyces sulfonofaciens]
MTTTPGGIPPRMGELPGTGGGPGPPAAGAGRLRVLTMNVLEPRYADGDRRRAALEALLAELDPDVLALQEITRQEAAALGTGGWHVAPHPHFSAEGPEGVGAALVAREPFDVVGRDPLRVTGRTEATPWCGVVVARLPLPEPLGDVLVVHHKPSWPYGFEREREAQAVAAARLVEDAVVARGARHVVLAGDLDAPPDAASIRFWRGLQSLDGLSVCYQDAWLRHRPDATASAGHTFSRRNPLVRRGDMPEEAGRRIDYVMVRCDMHGSTLRVAACERVGVDPVGGVRISDHYGVVADLTPPPHPPGRWA